MSCHPAALAAPALALLLLGCTPKVPEAPEDPTVPATEESAAMATTPDDEKKGDLIPVSDGLFMRVLGKDETGCMMYQPHAPGHSTIQAVHYRRVGGGFTMDRNEADCPPPE